MYQIFFIWRNSEILLEGFGGLDEICKYILFCYNTLKLKYVNYKYLFIIIYKKHSLKNLKDFSIFSSTLILKALRSIPPRTLKQSLIVF